MDKETSDVFNHIRNVKFVVYQLSIENFKLIHHKIHDMFNHSKIFHLELDDISVDPLEIINFNKNNDIKTLSYEEYEYLIFKELKLSKNEVISINNKENLIERKTKYIISNPLTYEIDNEIYQFVQNYEQNKNHDIIDCSNLINTNSIKKKSKFKSIDIQELKNSKNVQKNCTN